jgi:superfamily II DNA or RNA helicase
MGLTAAQTARVGVGPTPVLRLMSCAQVSTSIGRGGVSLQQVAALDPYADDRGDTASVHPEERQPLAGPPLRRWQRRALAEYLRTKPTDFLAVATPGAGKTTFALRVAAELLADRTITAVTVVVPTEHLKSQWALAATGAGIALDPTFRNGDGSVSRDFVGPVVTYAQVAAHPALHAARTANRRTLVILDEIHHGGDARTWGDAIRESFEGATRRLALTGTPFRSDDNPIPFVSYAPGPDGLLRSAANSLYGYGDALREGVVRPVIFLAYSGQTRWRTSAGDEISARLGEPLTADVTARAWRTALDPKGEWIPAVLAAADVRLTQMRAGGMPDAGGLVIATDQQTARAYAATLRTITGSAPTLVLSDEPGSSARIAAFAKSTDRWMVAVRMVSEGVDVPRLAVGVYATSASTALYFAQAIGRFVRVRTKGETASIFLPSVPGLLSLAGEMEAERDHVLGAPKRPEDEIWDDSALVAANREESERLDDGFEVLEASAELDQVIFDGASFGTAAHAGTLEEEEYLGLPGLLTPEQVGTLLRQRQQAQLARRSPNASQAPAVVAVDPDVVLSTFEVRAGLRKELAGLVAAYHHRTGKPHGSIHAELRVACGGPQVALAATEQLAQRIEKLRSWTRR